MLAPVVGRVGLHVLVSEPTDRDATFGQIRDYLTARPEIGDSFELPLVTTVLRAVRR